MNARDVLETLIAGLAASKSGEVAFRPSEVSEWPKGILETLLNHQVITTANPARSLDCDGCEMNCFMPVIVLPGVGQRPSRAFISCDKPVNIGRVSVPLERLKRWKVTGFSVASALARCLSISTAPKAIGETPVQGWNLGMVKGTLNRGELKIWLGHKPHLEIAGQQRPLLEMLSLTGSDLEVNQVELCWLADHPLGSSEQRGYKPSQAKREARKVDSQRIYSEWRKLAKAYQAKRPTASDRETALHISRLPQGKGRRPDTIRRHL